MYKDKLNELFGRIAKKEIEWQDYATDVVINAAKEFIKYQNFVIEGVILSQARANGVLISNNLIEANNRERIEMHDKVIDAIISINKVANSCGMTKIFELEPQLASDGQLSRYDQNDHVKAAYMVARFVDEYYNLGLQFERYDRALDETTYDKIGRISDKEWFGATEFDLPQREYNEDALDRIKEVISERVKREDLSIDNFMKIINSDIKEVRAELNNGVQLYVEAVDDNSYNVRVETKYPGAFGVLTNETRPGFEKEEGTTNIFSAKEIFKSQLREVIKDNGGFSHQSIKENDLFQGR